MTKRGMTVLSVGLRNGRDEFRTGAVNEKREVSGHLSPPQRCRCI